MVTLDVVVLHALDGLVFGLILALLAVGLSLAFGLLDILNVAHGAVYMLGAVLAWFLVSRLGSIWWAVVVVPLVLGLVGLLTERFLLRPLRGNLDLTILVTFGLMMILQHATKMVFGSAPQMVPLPIDRHVGLFGFQYPVYRIVLALVAAAVICGLTLFLRRARYGKWILAVKQERELALSLGIPALVVQTVTFGIALALAGLAGVLAAPIVSVDHEMGLNIIISAFIIVIVGGLGDLWGSVVVAAAIGILENLFVLVMDPSLAKALVFAAVGAIVMLRPAGLFAHGLERSLR